MRHGASLNQTLPSLLPEILQVLSSVLHQATTSCSMARQQPAACPASQDLASPGLLDLFNVCTWLTTNPSMNEILIVNTVESRHLSYPLVWSTTSLCLESTPITTPSRYDSLLFWSACKLESVVHMCMEGVF